VSCARRLFLFLTCLHRDMPTQKHLCGLFYWHALPLCGWAGCSFTILICALWQTIVSNSCSQLLRNTHTLLCTFQRYHNGQKHTYTLSLVLHLPLSWALLALHYPFRVSLIFDIYIYIFFFFSRLGLLFLLGGSFGPQSSNICFSHTWDGSICNHLPSLFVEMGSLSLFYAV
jgi:hypothetical protein